MNTPPATRRIFDRLPARVPFGFSLAMTFKPLPHASLSFLFPFLKLFRPNQKEPGQKASVAGTFFSNRNSHVLRIESLYSRQPFAFFMDIFLNPIRAKRTTLVVNLYEQPGPFVPWIPCSPSQDFRFTALLREDLYFSFVSSPFFLRRAFYTSGEMAVFFLGI